MSGNQLTRTDPATVTGIGYVHPTQADLGAPGGTFIAIGTAKGVGVSACDDDYDAKWTVYIDGEINGVYFCLDIAKDSVAAGNNPSFKLQWVSNCSPFQDNAAWGYYWGGALVACTSGIAVPHDAAAIAAGLETTGGSNTDRNIDVTYSNMKRRAVGGSYVNFDPNAVSGPAPNYAINLLSTTKWDVYLPPLN